MSEYELYRLDLNKPQYGFFIRSEKSVYFWMIPCIENLTFRNSTRIAFEIEKEEVEDLCLKGVLLESGPSVFLGEGKNKISLEITRNEGILSGRFTLYVPSWGRFTYRRIWIMIPV